MERSRRRKDRNTTTELVEGNDSLLGKHWQLPGPGGRTRCQTGSWLTWKCRLAGIMNGQACLPQPRSALLSCPTRSSPCPALAEVSMGTDLRCSYRKTIQKSSRKPHPAKASCLVCCHTGSRGKKVAVISASPAPLAVIGLILALRIKISPVIVENQDHLVPRN